MTIDHDRLHDLTQPSWSPSREDAVLARLEANTPRRSYAPAYIAAGLAAAVLLTIVLGRGLFAPETAPAVAQADAKIVEVAETGQRSAMPLQFSDGTLASPHNEHSEVVVASATDSETTVRLRRGGARFEVTPNPDRLFRVEAGLVSVDVLGTEFDCTRKGDRVRVAVIRGLVKVSWPGGSRQLSRGEVGTFPPLPHELPDATVHPDPTLVDPAPSSPLPTDIEGETDKGPTAEELMRTADRARKAGKVGPAISALKRVVAQHPRDSRAPLAAFTLGRLELERGNHQSAARYFAKVRRMGKSSLREHALAREVEAWSAAGNATKAKRRAEEYLRRFPGGPRAKQVRRLGGVSGD